MELERIEKRAPKVMRVVRNAAKRSAACLLLLAVLASSAPTTIAGAAGVGGQRSLGTMSVNLWIGAGTEPILALDPTDPGYFTNLIAAVTGVYYEVVASQPTVRLAGVADQIAARLPDIVAVVEGTLVRNQSPGDLVFGGTNPATNVVFDYVQILLDALDARGVHYAVASTSEEWDIELPAVNMQTGTIDDVRQTDREAILVRTDLPRGQLRVANPKSGHFANVLQIPSIGLSIERGWCSVDVFVRGQVFRYICTHLEEETIPQLQVLQVQDLLAGPAKTSLPVILVGDFNTDPLHRDGSVAYDTVVDGGFSDTWAKLNSANPTGGLTWGHDELLADPTHLFDRRIDFVFFRGAGFVPTDAEVIDMFLGRTELPLWASDHAALAAKLAIQRAPFAKAKAKAKAN